MIDGYFDVDFDSKRSTNYFISSFTNKRKCTIDKLFNVSDKFIHSVIIKSENDTTDEEWADIRKWAKNAFTNRVTIERWTEHYLIKTQTHADAVLFKMTW